MARIDPELTAALGTTPAIQLPAPEPERLTLLDLVTAVSEFARSDAEVVAVVEHLIATGRVVLIGQFCGPHLLSN